MAQALIDFGTAEASPARANESAKAGQAHPVAVGEPRTALMRVENALVTVFKRK